MEFFQPPITVVRQPVEAMGELAARLILDLIDGRPVENKPHVVPSRLLMRSSIVPPS
jgi:LacI family transcriptional regulator